MLRKQMEKIASKIGLSNSDASIWYIVALMGGAIILIAYFSIIPLIGYNLEAAVTIPGYINDSNHAEGTHPGSGWNSTVNSNMVTGVSLWEALGPIAKTGAITAGIAAMILIVMTMAGGMGRRQ